MGVGVFRKKERIPPEEGRPYFIGSWPFLVLAGLAIVGIFATAFLTYRHIALTSDLAEVGASILCRASGRINCDAILLTDYAVLFGFISSSALGLTGFVFVLWISVIASLRQGLRKIALAALVLYFFGAMGFSWYYLYLMAFKVDYICTWCIVAHAVNFISLTLTLALAIIRRKEFLLEEIVSYTEQACFLLAGIFLALSVFLGATAIEKQMSLRIAKADYEAIANDPVVRLAMVVNAPTYELEIQPDDPVLGNRNASCPIFFFSDYQCSACAKALPYFKSLTMLNKDKICLVFRQYPLSKKCNWTILDDDSHHEYSCLAARAGQAVYMLGGFQKYLRYSNMLYANRKRIDPELINDFARKIGMDMNKFKEMLKEGSEADKKILADIEKGIELRIRATPRVFFLGKRMPVDYRGEALVNLMEQMVRGERPDLAGFELLRPPPIN